MTTTVQQTWKFPHDAGIEEFLFIPGNDSAYNRLQITFTNYAMMIAFHDRCDRSMITEPSHYGFSHAGGVVKWFWCADGASMAGLLSALAKTVEKSLDKSPDGKAFTYSLVQMAESDPSLTAIPTPREESSDSAGASAPA